LGFHLVGLKDPNFILLKILHRNVPCYNSLCTLLNHGYIPDSISTEHIPLNIISGNQVLYQDLIADYAPPEASTPEILQQKFDILAQNNLG
jgi:hypothetical protein